MSSKYLSLLFAAFALLCAPYSYAEDTETLKVGYNEYNMDFDSDLWDRVAKNAGFKYKFLKYDDIGDLIKDVEAGKLDIAMGGISITSDREKTIDFSKPYLNTGLKIAVLKDDKEPDFIESVTDTTFIKGFISSMTSPAVKVIAFWFFIFIIVMAHIIWFAERESLNIKKESVDAGEIDESYLKGIGEAIYFCLVTSSTVGYGDFTTKRLFGRICSAIVIITGVSFFANLTGYIAAERAVDIVSETEIQSFKDLGDKTVATKAGTSTSKDRLDDVGAFIVEVPGDDWVNKAKGMLRSGEVDAIVWDSPLIDKIEDEDIKKIDKMFYLQYYGFCMQENSDIEESLNISLLSILSTSDYTALLKKHYNR